MAELTVKYTAPLPDGFTSGMLEIKRPNVYIDSQGRKAHAYQLARINPDLSLTEVQTGQPLKIIGAGLGDPAGGELDWVETLVVQGLPEPLRQTARIPAVYTAPGEIDLHRPSANTPLIGAPNDAVQQAEEAARQAEEARRLAEAGLGRLETAEEEARRAEAELRQAVDALRDYALDGRLEQALQVLPGAAENQERIDALLAQMQSDIAQFPDLLARQVGLEQTLGNFGDQLADAEDLFQEVKRAYQVVLDAQAELSRATRAAADARDAAQRSAQQALDSNNQAAAHAETSISQAASAVQAADVAIAHASEAGTSAATASAERQQAQTAAGEASSQAGIAREQATASASSAGAASTAAQAAESARLETASARDGAAQSASAALTSQQQASSSASEAGQAASAARGSSLSAESAASSAAGSASVAAGHAATADQRARAALTSQEAAQSSATAAGQSASAAQSSALSAEASRGAALRLAGNPDFSQGLEGWTPWGGGTEAEAPTLTPQDGVELLTQPAARGGRVLRLVKDWQVVGYRRPVPVDATRTYRLTVKARRTVDQGRGAAGLVCLDAEGRELDRRYGGYFANVPWKPPVGEWDTKAALYTGTGDTPNNFPPGTISVRPFFFANIDGITNELDYLLFEDVTSETAASGHAAASQQSAAAAKSSADAAGERAEAARGWNIKAETASGAAARSATDAAGAAEVAAGHAEAAQRQASAAVESAAAAKSSSDVAGQQAEAAQGSRVAAEAARDQAAGSAGAAQGSADRAQDQAQAASVSAETAKAQADEASHSAEAARGWNIKAETAQSVAQQAADDAGSAANTAAGHATTAQQQATAAVDSAAAAKSSSDAASIQAQAAQASRVSAEAARDQAAGSAGTADTQAKAAASSAEQAAASSAAAGQSAEAARVSRLSAEAAQGEAAKSASAAVDSAATAKSHTDEASRQAAASQRSQVAAETAQSAAEGAATTSAHQAQIAQDFASASSNSAELAKANQDEAARQAEAARGWNVKAESAQSAAQQAASNAGTSASNAAGSASAAQTQARAAAESAAQAKTSSDAAGSASSAAQQSALSAEASRGAALRLAGNPDFALGLEGWTAQTGGLEAQSPPLAEGNAVRLVSVPEARGGQALHITQSYITVGPQRQVAIDPTRTYRLTVRAKRTVDQGRGAAGLACLDGGGRELGRRYGAYFQNTPWAPPAGEWDTKTTLYTGTGDTPNNFPPGTVSVRPFFFANIDGGENELDYLLFEDVTSEAAAGGHVTAAAQSASAASASATDAGQQAQAAQASRVAAETAQGNAQGAAAAALDSKQAAANSAAASGTSAKNAADSSEAARLAKVAAEDARGQAQGSAAAAAQSASQASSSQTAAQQSAQASESSRVAAVAAQGAAETAKGQAADSAAAASTQAQAAQASAGAAGQSATAAETSRQSAATAQGAAEAARNSAAAASDKAAQAQQQASTSASTAKAQADAAQGSAAQASGSAATAQTYMRASMTAQAFQPQYGANVPAQKDRLGGYWMPHYWDDAFQVQARADGMGDNPHISLPLPAPARYTAVGARVLLHRKPEYAMAVIWGADGGYAALNLIDVVAGLPLYTWHTLIWDFGGANVQSYGGFSPGNPIRSVSLYFHYAAAEPFLFGLRWLAAGTISAEPQTNRAEFTQYVDTMKAETVLKVQAGNVIAGIGLRSESGTGSAVNILADRFVVSTAGGSKQPFIVTNGQIAIDGDLIATGSITAAKLQGQYLQVGTQLSDLPGTIDKGKVTGDFSDRVTTIDGGKITTGTIDASRVNVTNLNAGNITAGYMSANRVRAGLLESTNGTSFLDLDTGAVRFGAAGGANLTYTTAGGLKLSGSVIAQPNLQPSALAHLLAANTTRFNSEPQTFGDRSVIPENVEDWRGIDGGSWVDFDFFPPFGSETTGDVPVTALVTFESNGIYGLWAMDSLTYQMSPDSTGRLTAPPGKLAGLAYDAQSRSGYNLISLPMRAWRTSDGYKLRLGLYAQSERAFVRRVSLIILPGKISSLSAQ